MSSSIICTVWSSGNGLRRVIKDTDSEGKTVYIPQKSVKNPLRPFREWVNASDKTYTDKDSAVITL